MVVSLIDELQRDALNDTVSVPALLRKALVVSARLGLSDVPQWIENELSGYAEYATLPSYRIFYGSVMARHISGKWMPVQFPTSDLQDAAAKRGLFDSVARVYALSKSEGSLKLGCPPEQQKMLQNLFQHDGEFAWFFDRSCLADVLDGIRNQILRWGMELHKSGVRGDGLDFTDAEIETAHRTIFNIQGENVIFGVVGDVAGQANLANGHNARVNNQSTDKSTNHILNQSQDMIKMAEEFAMLRLALLPLAHDPEHYTAIAAVASAERAAQDGDASKISQALAALGPAGTWALGVARDIGVAVAATALKVHLGLPPG